MSLACSLKDFLCGATESTPWLNQHFDDYVDDIDMRFVADDVEPVLEQNQYGIASSYDECSALLVHRVSPDAPWATAEVVGYYNPPGAVCLKDAHQGHGLGAELILWTAIHLTYGPPTQSLDEQCFTAAGLAAHQAAWRLGLRRGWIIDPEAAPGRSAPGLRLR